MQSVPTHNEAQLLQRVSQGDENAFRELFHAYYDHIFGIAFTLTKSATLSEDLLQEIFISVWNHRHQLPDIDRFDNYLFIIARNRIYTELKKMARSDRFISELLRWSPGGDPDPGQALLLKESRQVLQQAIHQLPEQQRKVYELSRDQGLTYEEIALQLSISKSTVRNHMIRALQFIRQQVQNHTDGTLLLLCLWELLQP